MASRGAAAAALRWGKKAGAAGAGSGHQNQTTSIPRHILSAIVLGIAAVVSMTAAAKLPAHVAAQAAKSSPNLLREIFYGIGLGIFGGAFWKVHHLNERRKTEEFYARLEAGEITVAVE